MDKFETWTKIEIFFLDFGKKTFVFKFFQNYDLPDFFIYLVFYFPFPIKID